MCRLAKRSEESSEPSKKRRKGRLMKNLSSLPKPSMTQGKPFEWVEVASAPDRIAAGMLEGALKEEGIPVILQGPLSVAYLGVAGVHSVYVPEECAEKAREILREIWDVME
jgi:hypothetical protein